MLYKNNVMRRTERSANHDWALYVIVDLQHYFTDNGMLSVATELYELRQKMQAILCVDCDQRERSVPRHNRGSLN